MTDDKDKIENAQTMERTLSVFGKKFVSELSDLLTAYDLGDRAEIAEKVYWIIRDNLGEEPTKLKPDKSLYQLCEHYGWGGLDTWELMMEFEEEFGVSFQDEPGSYSIAGLVNPVVMGQDNDHVEKPEPPRDYGPII